MKHNFLAWRFLDPSPTDNGGGSDAIILKEIKALSQQHIEQVKEVKSQFDEAAKKAKAESEEEIGRIKAAAIKTQEELDEFKKKAATSNFGGGGIQTKSYAVEIEEKLTSVKDQLLKGTKFSVELDRKAVGNMGSTASLTGSYFVPPTVVPGVIMQPYNQVHMRNLLPIGNTTSNTIRYVRDNGGEGGPAMVAEAGSKPQMDRDLAILDANVRKVATHLRLPEEMIEDIPYITTFLTNIGTEEVLAVEDTQILYGDGTGQNLSGLFTNATAFAAPATAIVASPNRFDVLRAARLQIKRAKRNANFALVSPLDYYLMTSAKDSTGNYILQGGGNGLIPSLDGVPIIEMNQVVDNDFLVGDRLAAEIDFRSNIQVRFFEQDQDNAIKNLVTIVIEERLALPIYYATGLIKGTFTAAITDLTS
jgi:HK97 family phage major capsid protein